jgi:hypothetical protein
LTLQHRFGFHVAPWLVRDSAQSETRFGDRVSIHLQRGGNRITLIGLIECFVRVSERLTVLEFGDREL